MALRRAINSAVVLGVTTGDENTSRNFSSTT